MKLLVNELPNHPEDCLFSRDENEEGWYRCTLNDHWFCEGVENGECMMCITYDKFMFEKIEKCRNATCINVRKGETMKPKMIKFVLDGCDISFVAEAPADITLKQLLKQCDKIKPDYCACGIRSWVEGDYSKTELLIDYDSIKKADGVFVSCRIKEG